MWQQLTHQRYPDAITAHHHDLLTMVELQFRTNGIGCDKEDKQHHNTRNHHRRQEGVIVSRRITYLMQINGNGLQECLYLVVSISAGTHRSLTTAAEPNVATVFKSRNTSEPAVTDVME